MNRWRLVVGMLVAVVVLGVLPACGGDDRAGCPPLALGFLGPLTGPDRASGEDLRNAAALAVREHNNRDDGCEVGLVSYDTTGDPRQAEALARQIVADPQIIGVVGPVFSGETEAAMPVLDEAGVPVITPSATNPSLSQQGWETFHRLVGTDADQGPAAAAWLVEALGVGTVAVVDDGSLYGRTLADLTAGALDTSGVRIAPRQTIEPERRDYSEEVATVRDLDVDAVYFGGVGEAGTRFYRQLRDQGVDAVFMSGDGMFLGVFAGVVDTSRATGGADGPVVVTCPCVGVATTPDQEAFAGRFIEAWGSAPFNFAPEAFDATNVLLAGIDDGARTRSELLAWVSDVSLAGITSVVGFDADGEAEDPAVYVFTVSDGGFVTVGKFEDGELQPVGD